MSPAPVLRYTKEHNSFNAYYFDEFMRRWFDLRAFDQAHSSQDAILFGGPFDCDAIIPCLQQGRKIIVDNLQEGSMPDLGSLIAWRDQILLLTSGAGQQTQFRSVEIFEWFWYFESPWYRHRGYSNYHPQKQSVTHRFLMPMRLQKSARDRVVDALGIELDRAIWSYVSRGRELPYIPEESREDQRWFDPRWYDCTWFSVVNETHCEDHDTLFWTEKTCKPLAFFHPFLVIARPGLLTKLREFGFESWPELFDENYDHMPKFGDRLQAVTAQCRLFDPLSIQQPIIQQKLQHNHARFFDLDLIYRRMTDRLISPIMDFLETRI